MAKDVESLVLQMSADLRRFERQMGNMSAVAQRRLTQVEAQALKSQRNLERIMSQTGEGMVASLRSSLSSLAPTIAGAFSVASVVQYADAWTQGRNALAAAGVATSDLASRQEQLVDLANETRTSTESTIALYRRVTIATQEMGMSQASALRLTELLNKSFQTSGSSTQEAASAALQLSQALASGVLQGDELRSIRENAPQLAQAIAKAMGVGIGELKKLGAEGKITAKVVADAILGAGDAIEAKFAVTTVTVSQALVILNNQLGRYVGQTDESMSATGRMAQAIVLFANNLDKIIPVVTVLGTLVGGRYVLALTAAASAQAAAGISAVRLAAFQTAMTASMTGTTSATLLATTATRGLTAAMAANPIGAVLVLVTALAGGLYFLAQRYDETAIAARELDGVTTAADKAVGEYSAAMADAASKTGKERDEALKLAAAIRETTQARIADARVVAQKRIDEAVEARQEANTRAETAARMASDTRGGGNARGVGQTAQFARQATQRAETLKGLADDALATLNRLNAAVATAEAPARVSTAAPSGGAKDSKGASGPTPEELAAMRQMLDLQGQVELLRARGRDEEAKAIQRQIDTINLTKQYEEAGFADAKAKAETQVAALARAEQSAEFMAQFEKDQARFIEEMTEARQRAADITADELGYRVEIARLLGDESGIRAAEREEFIHRRINDLLAMRPELTRDQAEDQATGEADKLRGAEIVGELGLRFVSPVDAKRQEIEEINELLQQGVLNEQTAAAARAAIDDNYNKQRLSQAEQFFGALAGLSSSSNEKLAAIGKASALIQATIAGYVAIQEAWRSAPYPFNLPAVAITTAATAANVASIAGMADGGRVGGTGGPREDDQLTWLSTGEHVVKNGPAQKYRGVLDAMNAGTFRMPTIPSAVSLARPNPSAMTYSPTIDARGADLAAVARLESIMNQQRRDLPGIINGTREKRDRWRLGRNVEA